MANNTTNAFSARELEILAGAMQCTKSTIDVDYAKLATKCGFDNAPSASASWNRLKRKIEKMADGGAATPTSGKKRKAAEKNAEGDDAEATPTKAKAKRGRKPKKTEEEQERADAVPSVEGNGDGEEGIKKEDDDDDALA